MGLDINIETKHDLNYNKNYIFLHKDLDYSQMYSFFKTMIINFELF